MRNLFYIVGWTCLVCIISFCIFLLINETNSETREKIFEVIKEVSGAINN
jgi:hypothetical protein